MTLEPIQEIEENIKKAKVCPKCKKPFSYIEERMVGSKVYYYVIHYYNKNGKQSKKYCYLGERAIVYLKLLISYFENKAKEGEKEEAKRLLENYLE
jgi:hypothetical protein